MSVKRINWQIEILERALKSLAEGKAVMARSRISVAIAIGQELLTRAKKYQARDKESKK